MWKLHKDTKVDIDLVDDLEDGWIFLQLRDGSSVGGYVSDRDDEGFTLRIQEGTQMAFREGRYIEYDQVEMTVASDERGIHWLMGLADKGRAA